MNMFHKTSESMSKEESYALFLENVEGYLDASLPSISNLANLSALIKVFFDDINWVGFYLFDGKKLTLGPFQGLPACTEIALGRGVCGTAAIQRKPLNVPRTADFVGHIVCDEASQSELVIPILVWDQLIGVLDVDAPIENRFGELEVQVLSKAVSILIDKIKHL
mgnify:CR=1 FL=1